MSQVLATLPQYDPALKDYDGLTAKQRAFCDNYIELNSKPQPVARRGFGTEACRRAGYQGSDDALAAMASENLRRVKVREYIRRKLRLHLMSADEVLGRLSKQGRASIADVLDDEGQFSLKLAKKRGTDDLIKKLKTRTITRNLKDGDSETEVIHELELHNSQTALELMGKHHELFERLAPTQQVNINIENLNLVEVLREALEAGAIDVTPVSSMQQDEP